MTRARVALSLLAVLAAAGLGGGARPAAGAAAKAGGGKLACAYTAHSVRRLAAFGRLVHRRMDCAVTFNDAAPTWATWADPWLVHHPDPDRNWARWATAPGTHRRLVITQGMFPASERRRAWLRRGAAGAFTGHARALARRLVAAGVGNAIVRLGHEANGTWYPWSLGRGRRRWRRWIRFWRRTVLAMRSVPGARFRFDWTVNAAVRPLPLARIYPGDDAVDIVGVDAYDTGVRRGRPRWRTIYRRRGGIRDVARFARRHGKPLSIPEWGVGPRDRRQAGGDDPAYVRGIAAVVRRERVAYQGYFFRYGWARQLHRGSRSLAAYVRAFGRRHR